MKHLTVFALIVLAACSASRADAPAGLRLGTRGTQFTVDGAPRFLVLVSYFDALDAQSLDDDLAYLARHVDGIRIFANWWEIAEGGDCRLRFSPGTLFEARDRSIVVRPHRLERLKQVLRSSRRHGLVVDLTFAGDPVRGASTLQADAAGGVCPPAGFRNRVNWSAMAAALGVTAAALEPSEFDHVFFDVQNEAGHDFNRAGEQDLRQLVSAVKAADPSRLISVSMFDPDADRQARLVRELGLSLLNFHDLPRGKGWGARTAGHVKRFREALERAGVQVPIYAGEPDPGSYGSGVEEFRAAVRGARAAGAAAWTFHTRIAYDLGSSSLAGRLDADTRRALEAVRDAAGTVVN